MKCHYCNHYDAMDGAYHCPCCIDYFYSDMIVLAVYDTYGVDISNDQKFHPVASFPTNLSCDVSSAISFKLVKMVGKKPNVIANEIANVLNAMLVNKTWQPNNQEIAEIWKSKAPTTKTTEEIYLGPDAPSE